MSEIKCTFFLVKKKRWLGVLVDGGSVIKEATPSSFSSQILVTINYPFASMLSSWGSWGLCDAFCGPGLRNRSSKVAVRNI